MDLLRKIRRKDGTTDYHVSTDGGNYRVSVDTDGIWACDCPGSQFRGNCYHILAIRWQLEWPALEKRLQLVEPTPVKRGLFLELSAQPRYVVQVRRGERAILRVARDVLAAGKVIHGSGAEKMAGTVLDVLVRGDVVEAWDILFWKGADYRGFPLVDRLLRLSEALKHLPFVGEAPIETDPIVKQRLLSWAGEDAVLKDLGSRYDARVRNWMIIR